MIAAGTICVLYVIGSVCMTMLMPTSEIFAYTGTLDALVIACNLLEVPQFFVQIVAFGITLSIFGAVSAVYCTTDKDVVWIFGTGNLSGEDYEEK